MTESTDSLWEDYEDHDAYADEICCYCNNDDFNCLVQCANDSCKKWFCNSKIVGTKGSQIIWHMTKSGHNEIMLSTRNSLFPPMSMRCYYCSESNFFSLLLAMPGSMPVIICRECSVTNPQVDSDCELRYMIADRFILNELVSQATVQCSSVIDLATVTNLEMSIDKNSIFKVCIEKNPELFGSPEKYKETMQTFIEVLKDYEEYSNRMHLQEGVYIEWGKRRFGKFTGSYHKSEKINATFLPGLELKITNKEFFNAKAEVESIQNDLVTFSTLTRANGLENELFDVQVIGNFITHTRQQIALKGFHSVRDELQSIILNPEEFKFVPADCEIILPTGVSLNASQHDAVVNAMTQPVSLIQGPPGTGKTFTSAIIVYNYLNSIFRSGPALVCASSNTATDNLAEKMLDFGMKVVRVMSIHKEIAPKLLGCNLETLAQQACNAANEEQRTREAEAEKLQETDDAPNLLDYEDVKADPKKPKRRRRTNLDERREPDKEPKHFYEEILRSADVVCSTCSTAGSLKMLTYLGNIDFVLIDEATQSIEPETLIPLSYSPLRVVLVGDQNQLGPTAMVDEAETNGYYKSLFQRLIEHNFPYTMLNSQFRMHPFISLYPSNAFYDGKVQDGITEAERALPTEFLQIWANVMKPVVFHHVKQYEEHNPTGMSFINRHEYIRLLDILLKLRELEVDMKEVGLITPYEGQVTYIKQRFKEYCKDDPSYKFDEIQVSSIDGFQGKEKDFIIMSCVRSSHMSGIGFLNNPNRLNVALTRARKGIALVGNARVLMKDKLWRNYLNFLRHHNLIVAKEEESNEVESILSMLRRKKKDGVKLLPMPEFTSECFDNVEMYGNVYGDLANMQPTTELDLSVLAKGDWVGTDLASDLRRQLYLPKVLGQVEELANPPKPFRRTVLAEEDREEVKDRQPSRFAGLKTVRLGSAQPQQAVTVRKGPAKARVNFKNEKDRLIAEELGFTMETFRFD